MKKLLFVLALSLAVFLPRAQGIAINPPYLGSISNEVFSQLTTVTNELAATNNVVANKKLLKVLLGAQKLIAKTKTNHVAGAKSLGVLNKSLGRSSLSNEFNPLIQGTADIYVNVFQNILEDLEDRVDASFPGKANDAARKTLAQFLAAIDNADTNSNFLLVLKALGAAAKGEIGAQKAVIKAEAASAPPNSFTATVTASGQGTFTYKPVIQSVNAAYVSATHLLNIQSFDIKTSGSSFSSLDAQTKNIGILVAVPGDGTHTYNLSTDSNLIYYSFNHTHGGSLVFGEIYSADRGTVTLTFDSATKFVYGTFSFSGNGDNDSGLSATVNGSFAIHYLP